MGEDQVTDVRTLTEPVFQLVKIQAKPMRHRVYAFLGGKDCLPRHRRQHSAEIHALQSVGIPLRATLTVNFKEYQTLEEQLQRLNLQSADHSKKRLLKRGDTLALIAYQEYGDSTEWRRIFGDPRNLELIPIPVASNPALKSSFRAFHHILYRRYR